jgi:hypothetical protein
MRKPIGIRFSYISLIFMTLVVMTAAGNDRIQTDSKQLTAEAEKAWEEGDFPKVEAASRKHLAALTRLDSPEAVVTLFYLSGAETVAGKIDDAAGHLDLAMENLVRYTCRTQLFPYELAGAIVGQTLRDLPPRSWPYLQVMRNRVWDNLVRKGREACSQPNLYQGLATMLASGLTSLYLLSDALPSPRPMRTRRRTARRPWKSTISP